MSCLNIRVTDKCQKSVHNGNGKDHKISQKMVGSVQTNQKTNRMEHVYIRTDPGAKGMLMGCYPGHRKYITGLVQSCRNKNIPLIIEDKETVMHLAQYEILLKESELSNSLLADEEIQKIISKE